MMRFLSSTTLSATKFSSRRLASALRYSDAKAATCVATAVLLGGAFLAGPALAGSASNGASDTSFTYSQVEADPLAPVATLVAKAGTIEDSTAGYTPPEYDGIRTIEIDMSPRAFNEKAIEVYKGETVRFVLRNSSPMSHEFTVGTSDMQDFRRRFMSRVVKAEHQDIASDERELLDSWNAIVVMPGETRELVWTFDKTENIEFGCNIHGHYEAGMKGHFTTIATEETTTAENAEADPLASATSVPAAPMPAVEVAAVPAPETTTAEPAAADPLAPPPPPAFETAEADTASPETQTTIITPAAVTSATETPARLEPGLDIISPNISTAEFAALINEATKTLAEESAKPDTAEAKSAEVKTAALNTSTSDATALEGTPDSSSVRKIVAFASGTLPDNGLDFPGVRRNALVQTASANIQADPQSDAQVDPLSSRLASSSDEPSLQELARQQSSRYEAEQRRQAEQVPTPKARPTSWKPAIAAGPIPRPGSRLAALNAEGLTGAGRLSDEGQSSVATLTRKKFVVLSIRDHMRMGKMREQALLSRSLELREFAKLAPAPTQLSVPAKRSYGGAVVNFSSTQYGGSAGEYRSSITDKGERAVPAEVVTIRRISDSTIRTLDNAGSALLRTAGSLIKRVGLDDEIVSANTSRERPALVEEYGSGEFGESKK